MAAARLCLSVLVLMLAAITVSEGVRGSGPKKCCVRFIKKLPEDKVVGYMRTSQRCSQPAIVLKTEAGHQLCARPSAAWVKETIKNLNAKSKPGEASNL
ncbi:C-C motif chemokine 4-like [Paralichthys olivaceus]|uniref:CC chemokine, Paol-SCYA105 n=1 Tax=Paralichthys olivaceus TaxID=8255 RepID=A0A090AT91_PAROL|nr:CC chemokine, Paol-SCYA105 [Paralichthys olivaceus]BAP59752.1 CC chemokine, Paol-SCYA105 [Paralichthys olivaceus]